ncbi:MAG TPA: hypothetical protein VL092_02580 [Chitinophagaceae bacterium]|nr:hypothetical protein [Chitinophagaceae bacterium]
MSKLIVTEIPVSTIDGIRANMQANANSLEQYKVNLTEEQKKSGRTMASGREGLVRLISQIASNNINSLPREHNPADLAGKLTYDGKLEELRQALLRLMEIVAETQLANSIDIMKMADDYASALQISRNNNGSLDLAMREVDDWNSRFGQRNTPTPPQE